MSDWHDVLKRTKAKPIARFWTIAVQIYWKKMRKSGTCMRAMTKTEVTMGLKCAPLMGPAV